MLYNRILLALFLVLAATAAAAAFAPLSNNRLSNRVVHTPPLSSLCCFSRRNKTPKYLKVHGNKIRKRACRTLGSLAFAVSILTRSSNQVAFATTSLPKEELRANDIILNSLKPGISREEAEKLAAGIIVDQEEDGDIVLGQSSLPSSSKNDENKLKTKRVEKSTSVYDYGQDEYEDEDDENLDFEFEGDVKESDISPTKSITMGSSDSFAMSPPSKRSTKMYATATFSILVIPVTWLQTREFLRGRREQLYVEKGLEILQAQKAEYFNITTTSDDSDIQDELKDLKNKKDENDEDNDEDDDDDEDDGEDDDEDEDDRPSRPKKPRGGGGGDGDDDNDDDEGSGPPSDEDVDRLNKMFKKS